ncbi:hypothetical protein BD408DRAFT_421239, partial [Parasitella parasitica]
MTITQDTSLNTQNTPNTPNTVDNLPAYLVGLANKLQTRVDDAGNNMSKKLEEITKRIDTLERGLKQMEESPANLNLKEPL